MSNFLSRGVSDHLSCSMELEGTPALGPADDRKITQVQVFRERMRLVPVLDGGQVARRPRSRGETVGSSR